jgi:hypothetical protein
MRRHGLGILEAARQAYELQRQQEREQQMAQVDAMTQEETAPFSGAVRACGGAARSPSRC